MRVRTHRNGDIPSISRLYYETIHFVNSRDYTDQQIAAWAPAVPEDSFWKERFKKYQVYVAEQDECIVGFTELDPAGHIDCFFVHHEWQRCGVGRRLMERIVASAGKQQIVRLFAEVSITAESFFLNQNFVVVREYETTRRRVKLKQFVMERWLTK